MSIVNLKESLLQMDRDTDCKYDLTTLYEACNLDEKKKKQLVQFVNNYDIEATNNLLSNEASSQGLMETVEDDLSDEELKDLHIEVQESFNEEKINITVNSTDREPPEKYVYNSITDAKQGIKRNGICKDDISNISGCDIEDLFESINESNNMNDDDLWEVIDDEEFEFHGVQDVGYDDDSNIVVVFNHAISDEIIEPTAEELLTAFRQYGYPVHDWNTNGTNVFILTSGNILNSISEATQGIKASNSRLNEIRDEINKAVKKVMMSPEFGFLEDEVDEYSVVEVSDENDRIKVEVRAEVGYEGLMTLCNALDPIIQKYDKDTYFEPVTSGIIDAYISKNQSNNKRDYFESMDESVADNYDEYNTITYQRTKYSIHYTHINTDPNADSLQMFKEFKATVSEIHPYDDADYTWAQIENGIIKYIKNGKVIDKSYYMTAEDWDLENNEWCDAVIDEAVYNLAELNKDVEPKMIHESKSIDEGLTLKEDMWDYESDFSDGEVEAGDTFDYEGVEYEWIQQYGDTAHLDFDAWAIWEASPVDMDDDNPETKFFIVDVDTGFIDWGPCDTVKEAQEFLQSKVNDWENDDLDESIKVGDKVKVTTPGNNHYDGCTGVVDYTGDGIVTVKFDDNNSPRLNNFDLNQVTRINESKSIKEGTFHWSDNKAAYEAIKVKNALKKAFNTHVFQDDSQNLYIPFNFWGRKDAEKAGVTIDTVGKFLNSIGYKYTGKSEDDEDVYNYLKDDVKIELYEVDSNRYAIHLDFDSEVDDKLDIDTTSFSSYVNTDDVDAVQDLLLDIVEGRVKTLGDIVISEEDIKNIKELCGRTLDMYTYDFAGYSDDIVDKIDDYFAMKQYQELHNKHVDESKSIDEGLTLKEDMWDYESDFSDGEVEAGDTFDYEGVEYEWIQQYGDTAHLDFDAWAIWEASPVDMDDDNPETKFFIVDVDTGFIDWDCDSLKEAQEFLNSKIDDYNSDDDDEFDYYDITEGIEDDELSTPDQEFDSATTSINSNKLPAIYRMITIPKGTIGVDFGGGRFDNAVEHIKDLGATLCVYDPYNRSAEHNKEVIKTLRSNGGADWAINSNVLNVIKEPEARKAVLENISKITKAGAPIYITVYEGRGDNKEGPTKSGYQLNRKTADYLEDIQEVFPDATRKGKLIIAHNSKSISEEVQPKLSTNSKGDYLVKSSTGKGYTVFNKDDTCIGGFDGENDNEAKNKFMSGKINEDMEGQFSNKFFKLAAKYGEDNELYPLVKNLIRYTKEEDLKDLWYDKGYNKQEDSDDVDESIYTPNSKSQIEEEIKKITNNFTIKEDTIQCGFKEECDSAVNLLKENYTKVKSQKVGDWFRINFSK